MAGVSAMSFGSQFHAVGTASENAVLPNLVL